MKSFNNQLSSQSNYPFSINQSRFPLSAPSRQPAQQKKKQNKNNPNSQACQDLTQKITQAVSLFLQQVKKLYRSFCMHYLFNQLQVKRIIVVMTAPVILKPDQFYSQYRDVGFHSPKEPIDTDFHLSNILQTRKTKNNTNKKTNILKNEQDCKMIKKIQNQLQHKTNQKYKTRQKKNRVRQLDEQEYQQYEENGLQNCIEIEQNNSENHKEQDQNYNYINFQQDGALESCYEQDLKQQQKQTGKDLDRKLSYQIQNNIQKLQQSNQNIYIESEDNENNQNQSINQQQCSSDYDRQNYLQNQMNQIPSQQFQQFNNSRFKPKKKSKEILEDEEQIIWWRRPIENQLKNIQYKAHNVTTEQQMQLGKLVFENLQKKWSISKVQIKAMAKQLSKPQYQKLKTSWAYNYLIKNQAIRNLMQTNQATVCASLAACTKPKIKCKIISSSMSQQPIFPNEISFDQSISNRIKSSNYQM